MFNQSFFSPFVLSFIFSYYCGPSLEFPCPSLFKTCFFFPFLGSQLALLFSFGNSSPFVLYPLLPFQLWRFLGPPPFSRSRFLFTAFSLFPYFPHNSMEFFWARVFARLGCPFLFSPLQVVLVFFSPVVFLQCSTLYEHKNIFFFRAGLPPLRS